MARIPYFDTTQATGRAAKAYSLVPDMNVFRMMGHAGDLVSAFMSLGNHLLMKAELDPVLREIAIIRVGVLKESAYELQQHEGIGRRLGMSDELIAAVHEGPDASAFDDVQRCVMAFTDDVIAHTRAGDATFGPVREHLGDAALVELTITVGFYAMVSAYLRTLDVDLEDGGEDHRVNLPGMAE